MRSAATAMVSFGLIAVEDSLPEDGTLCLCRWVDASGQFPEMTVARYAAHDGFDTGNGRITHWAEMITFGPGAVLITGIEASHPTRGAQPIIGEEGHPHA